MITEKTTKEILVEARALIEHPANWTQGELAHDRCGYKAHPNEPRAVCWCAIGALKKVCDGNYFVERTARVVLDNQARSMFGEDVVDANDRRTHSQVLAIFDEAIRARQ
jgi:hypothetical protein